MPPWLAAWAVAQVAQVAQVARVAQVAVAGEASRTPANRVTTSSDNHTMKYFPAQETRAFGCFWIVTYKKTLRRRILALHGDLIMKCGLKKERC